MPPQVLARRLKGLISRPNRIPEVLTVTIRTLAELASSSKCADMGVAQVALHHSSMLCDAVAYHLRPSQVEKLRNTPPEFNSYLVDLSPIDKLAAFAVVGNFFQVKQLLSEGIDPNIESEYLGYPVQQAALNNNPEIFSLLLHQPSERVGTPSASDSERTNKYSAALIAASSAGHEHVVNLILSSAFDAVPQQHHSYAISAAAANGHINVLRSLFSWQKHCPSSDNTAIGQSKTTAFLTACAHGYPGVAQLLLSDYGVDASAINHEGRNGLHMAAQGGHARVTSLLFRWGTRYYSGLWGDPVHLAAKNGHEDAVRVLLDWGADVEADGGSDTDIACGCARNGQASMLRFLISRGLDLNSEGRGGAALEEAAAKGHVEMVEMLVGLGVDIDGRKGMDGPMLKALMCGQDEIVKALKRLGARDVDVSKTDLAAAFEDGEFPRRWNP